MLTALTMIAFAANSVLNRLGIATGDITPLGFALVRVCAGAVTLLALLTMQGRFQRPKFRIVGALSLVTYMVGFSLAYLTLDAGIGALILFGGVQITMFAGVLLTGGSVPLIRWVGASIAFAGLVYLLAPSGDTAPDFLGSMLMLAAAVGWGVYSLVGRVETDALAATTANFVYALPFLIVAVLIFGSGNVKLGLGLTYAIVSGAVTSAMGYALWYSILPRLEASVAAVAQLTVPIIALAGGMLFLGEELTLRFVITSVLVLGGVALSLRKA
ncbi:membrane protein [Litoreibacter roseus]|uniref:Membrane protein n=1 Tax=Litoreibacter roseus TaxID=2601869 RepID=A0A6N6JJC7_9RHOB|nr:membrane protein [Litoreibacter roseus]